MAATYMLASYIILAIFAVILMCSEPTECLTAFGKTQTTDKGANANATKPTRKPAVKTCSTDADCKVRQTLCRLDHIEGRKHCTCPDNSAPDNGLCKQSGQAPGKNCSDSIRCTKNAECITNGTRKVCECFEGYDELNHHGYVYCNGFERLVPLTSSILYAITSFGCLRTILQFR